MHKHWFFKFLAIVLAILSGASLILGGLGMLLGEPLNLYLMQRENILESRRWSIAENAGSTYLDRYVLSQSELSAENYMKYYGGYAVENELEYTLDYRILDAKGNVLAERFGEDRDYVWVHEFQKGVRTGRIVVMPELTYYPTYDEFRDMPPELWAKVVAKVDNPGQTEPPMTTEATIPGTTHPGETTVPEEVPEILDQIPPLGEDVVDYDYVAVPAGARTSLEDLDPDGVGTYFYSWLDADDAAGGTVYRLDYFPYVYYQVQICMTQDQLAAFEDTNLAREPIYTLITGFRQEIVWLTLAGGIGLVVSILWLCLMAGLKPGTREVKPEGTNRIPLDIFLAALVGAGVVVVLLVGDFVDSTIWRSVYNWEYYELFSLEMTFEFGLVGLLGAGFALVLVLFLMALSAQAKQGDNLWLKNTLIGRCGKLGWYVTVEVFRGTWKILKAVCLWTGRTVRTVWYGCGRGLRRLNDLMPLTWQWLVASFVLWALVLLAALTTEPALLVLVGLLGAAVILYGAYCFGRLRDSAKRMSRGELDVKIDTGLMAGCFKEFAADLNSLGDVCRDAALEQTKHERMKSELITNVSHDIKTPLTSIINYVDLLRSCETEEQRQEYLEVLDRQSQRLKKLIEDLMEMSKASSGNVTVELASTDVCEGVMQALGEFADRMEQKRLNLVYSTTQQPLMAVYDGKLLWRVLSNVLGNVVKYALAGTRVYVNVYQENGRAVVAVKNISAEPLNITAEELMERFVRGDESRNTEGNGLGLNIARSLMEVQNGDLDLVVDGDLFKVVLSLPLAQ